MTKKWSEVINSQEYKGLSSSEKRQAQQEYWDTVVVPKAGYKELGKNEQEAARREFFGEKSQNVEYQNKWGQIFNVPGAAIRSAVQGKGYIQGALQPSSVPSFQDVLSEKVNTGNPVADFYLKTQAGVGGAAMDMATDPMTYAFAGAAKLAEQPAAAFAKWIAKPKTLKGLSKLRVKSSSEGAKFAASLRDKFYNFHKSITGKFGNQVKALAEQNPNRVVDLTNTLDEFSSAIDDMAPEARNAIKKVPLVKKLLNSDNKSATVKEVQDAMNYISTKIPKEIKATHLDVVDFKNSLSAAQLDAFPEMAGVRAEYRAAIEPWKAVKSKFKINKTLKAIENDFGGAEGIEAVKKIFPKEMVKEMGGYKKAAESLNRALKNKTTAGDVAGKIVKYYLIYRFGIGAIDKLTGQE